MLFGLSALVVCAGLLAPSGAAHLDAALDATLLAVPFLSAAVAIVWAGFWPRLQARDLVTGFALMVVLGTAILARDVLWLPSLVPMVLVLAGWLRSSAKREAQAQPA